MSVITTDVDDNFYDNITVGLLSKLRNTANVSDVQIERRIPCNRLMISAWEHSNNVVLPNDLKQFYSATDGFKLMWKYNNFGNSFVSDITINTLSTLNRLGDLNREYGSWIELLQCEQQTPKRKSDNIFLLNHRKNVGYICLVYCYSEINNQIIAADGVSINNNDFNKRKNCDQLIPGIWLLDKSYQWHELATSFTIYFRMALVHMGLPLWQFRFTPIGLTPNIERIMATFIGNPTLHDSPIHSNVNNQNQLNLLVFKNGHTSNITNRTINTSNGVNENSKSLKRK